MSPGRVIVPKLSERVDELERQLDALRQTPQDTIADTNIIQINSKGEVEPTTPSVPSLGVAEYLDTFQEPEMPNWLQAPLVHGNGGLGIRFTPTPGKGLVLTNFIGDPLVLLALLVVPEYFEEPYDVSTPEAAAATIAKPLLGYYEAILSVTLAIPMPPTPGTFSSQYGFRLLDTSEFTVDASKPYPGNASEALDVHFCIEKTKLVIEWTGYGAGARATREYNVANKSFWLRIRCFPKSNGDEWQATVFDKPPGEWASQPTGDGGLLSSNVGLGVAESHRLLCASNVRMGLYTRAAGIGKAEREQFLAEELGARINYLRVMPQFLTHANL